MVVNEIVILLTFISSLDSKPLFALIEANSVSVYSIVSKYFAAEVVCFFSKSSCNNGRFCTRRRLSRLHGIIQTNENLTSSVKCVVRTLKTFRC